MLNFITKAAGLINKGVQAHKAIKAANAPKPKPAPRRVVSAKKPVTVLPPAPRPVVLPKKVENTVDVLGVKIPKPVAYVGGTVLAAGALYGGYRLVSR
jgi:hypothetical protein